MGMLKLAAIVAIGVSLLPADREKQEQLYQRAADAATWTMTFCDRNAETCDKAQDLWAGFYAKAQFGAQLAFDVIRDNNANDSAGEPSARVAPAAFRLDPPRPLETHGTLTRHDLQPAWRGKTASKAGI